MNLKASVAPQSAFGHPLLAPLVSTHASATQVSPPCEGGVRGVVRAKPSTGLLKGILTGLASPRTFHLRESVRGVRSVRRHPPEHPLRKGGGRFSAIEVCVETNASHSGARGLFVIVSQWSGSLLTRVASAAVEQLVILSRANDVNAEPGLIAR